MGLITLKKQSSASVPNPSTDQLRLFVDSADDILKTKDSTGVVRPSGVGTADELATTGAPVDVSASAPPSTGGILTADSATTATWKTPAEVGILQQTSIVVGPDTYNANVGDLVRVNVSSGAVTVYLPSAIGITNQMILVKLVSLATNNCTIDASGTQTIDGALTVTLSVNYEWAWLRSDGANWMQIG